jgi:hypothetical protein
MISSFKNKKGQSLSQLVILVAISIVIILFFGIWIFGTNIMNDELQNIGVLPNTEINFTEITEATMGKTVEGYDFLKMISMLMIFGFSLSILLSSFLERTHPGLGFVIHLFLTIIGVIFAAYVSNTYEDLLLDPVFGSTLAEFTASNFIMANLPMWIAVIGIAGMILLMSGIPRDRDLGGGVVR